MLGYVWEAAMKEEGLEKEDVATYAPFGENVIERLEAYVSRAMRPSGTRHRQDR